MKEEKIDRLIRNAINDGMLQNPSSRFTEGVMEKMGLSNQEIKLKTKPVRSKWGLRSMVFVYIILIIAIFLIPGGLESSGYQLPKLELPSISQYFELSGSISKLLLMLIIGGWILIFIDNYAKKLFMR
jgi:hypothetical protein